jgi:predicted PhzF superfamily epimerase YddE/YHI9
MQLCGHATLATAQPLGQDGARTEPADVAGLAQALGIEPQELHWVPALREILAVLDVPRTVRELRPDLPAVSRLDGIRGCDRGPLLIGRAGTLAAPNGFA